MCNYFDNTYYTMAYSINNYLFILYNLHLYDAAVLQEHQLKIHSRTVGHYALPGKL